MAKSLSKTGITTGNTVKAFHVTQSIDAFSGTDAYDIVLSGSLNINNAPVTNLTASNNISASNIIATKLLEIPLGTAAEQGGIYFSNGTLGPADETPSIRGEAGVEGVGYLALGHSDQDTIKVKSQGLPDSVRVAGSMIVQNNITASGKFIGNGSTLTNLQRPISNSVSTHFTASNLNAGFYFRAGGNVTCSLQSGSLVTCDIGNEYEIFQTSSAGNIIFVTGSGVTLNSKSSNIKLTGQFSAATLKKISSNPDTWDLIGDLN